MRIRFSIFTLLVVTAIIAAYFASRDTDLLALNMNSNEILPLPLDTYPDVPGRWWLLNPRELPLDGFFIDNVKSLRACLALSALRCAVQFPIRWRIHFGNSRGEVQYLLFEMRIQIAYGLVVSR